MAHARGGAPAAVDVAVVGGGIVGCATAAYLADAGARVLLVEERGVAAAASGRNSGVVQHPFDPVLAELYRATVRLLRELEAASPAGFALPAEPSGLLYVSEAPEAAHGLASELAASHPEIRPEFLGGAELTALEPALAPDLAACRLAIGYPVGPARVTEAFAALAVQRGVTVEVGESAALDRRNGTVGGIVVGGRRIAAGAVVVAAGPWTPALIDPTGAWRPVRPLWGAVVEVALADPPRHVLEELEIDATIEPDRGDGAAGSGSSAATPVAFSLVSADGRSAVGSTFEADEPDDTALAPAIARRASRFVPAIAAAPVTGTRRCARPLSLDGRPLIGAVPGIDRLFVAAGHGPWGISTGAASARLVADLVLARASAPPPALDPGRFGAPGEPAVGRARGYFGTAEIA
jgi:glycine/D-amino acid oxidase-like deaminating enzyme